MGLLLALRCITLAYSLSAPCNRLTEDELRPSLQSGFGASSLEILWYAQHFGYSGGGIKFETLRSHRDCTN